MVSLDGLEYVVMVGIGAILGMLFSLGVAFAALFIPALWPYVILPTFVGAVAGLAVANFAK